MIFIDRINDIVSFSFFEMEAIQDFIEENIGENIADILDRLGEVLCLCVFNFVLLLFAHLMMKYLSKNKNIESSKFLSGLKSIVDSTLQNL